MKRCLETTISNFLISYDLRTVPHQVHMGHLVQPTRRRACDKGKVLVGTSSPKNAVIRMIQIS
jgi:hypothetical protein